MLRVRHDDADLDPSIARSIESGYLAPDAFITAMVEHRTSMSDCRNGYLLDGFPRTLVQAESWSAILTRRDERLDGVIVLSASPTVLMDRLLRRGRDEGRADDDAETIGNRLRVYENQTRPVLGYYQGRVAMHQIDASKPIDAVTDAIKSAVGSHRTR